MSVTEIDLDVVVRAHTRGVAKSSDKKWREPKPLPQWAKHALLIDCETGTSLGQNLNFGFH